MTTELISAWQNVLTELTEYVDPPSFFELELGIDEAKDYSMETLIPLQEYIVVSVSGPKISQFLQGQCTCNFLTLDENKAVYGSHCTPKGRIIASFVAKRIPTNDDSECFGLRVHSSCAKALCTSLSKYGVFSKAKVMIDYSIMPFVFHKTTQPDTHNIKTNCEEWTSTTTATNFTLPIPFSNKNKNLSLTEVWLPRKRISEIKKPNQKIKSLNKSAWQLFQIRLGIYDIRKETSEALLPQEINHQLLDAIDFKKGCYTGQEIIARLHYRGQLKKQLQSIRIETDSKNNDASLPFNLDLNVGEYCDDPNILKRVNSEQLNIGQILLAARPSHNTLECLSILKDGSLKNEHPKITKVSLNDLLYN